MGPCAHAIDLLCEGASKSASDPNDEDYTVFWLVLADQFEKRGVAHAPTREKAIAIIDRGDDLMMMLAAVRHVRSAPSIILSDICLACARNRSNKNPDVSMPAPISGGCSIPPRRARSATSKARAW